MAETLKKSATVHVAEIVRHGEALTLPEKMSYGQAIELLKRREEYDEQVVNVSRVFDAFPWDGAVALDVVLTRRYGWSPAMPVPGFFGPKPPQLVSVEVAYGVHKNVPWGRFFVPGVEADLVTGVADKGSRTCFVIQGKLRRKYEQAITEMFEEVAAHIAAHSIYQGQAFRLNITKDVDAGEPPTPRFMDTDVDPETLIFSQEVAAAVETNVFTPIRRYADCKKAGVPFKRGVLLSGTWGVGKTLAAKVASKFSTDNGITFIVCEDATDLAACVEYAKLYQPAVIFCEDIDRTMEGERSSDMDVILNVVDGIDSKRAEVMIVLTTNSVDKINPAMLRPGRLDAVIDVKPPDAEAVERLLRLYGKGVIPASESLRATAVKLQGCIPAVVAEVVKRAKLAALKMAEPGVSTVKVGAAALEEAADTMTTQLELLYGKKKQVVVTLDSLIAGAVRQAFNGELEALKRIEGIESMVESIDSKT